MVNLNYLPFQLGSWFVSTRQCPRLWRHCWACGTANLVEGGGKGPGGENRGGARRRECVKEEVSQDHDGTGNSRE